MKSSLRKNIFFIFFIALCAAGALLLCSKNAAADIKYPLIPPVIKVGETLKLNVVTDAQLEFRWQVKHEPDDWVIVKDWNRETYLNYMPDRPGIYSFHVDLRSTTSSFPKVLVSKWLGQAIIPSVLVGRIVSVPSSKVLLMDTPVSFMVVPGEEPLEDLEFRLSVNSGHATNDWKVVQDYRSWPINDFFAAGPGAYDLQIDIRNRKDHDKLQMVWLDRWYFSEAFPKNNLIRGLIADDFNITSPKQGLKSLSRELWLSVNILLMEFEGKPAEAQIEALKRLSFVKDVHYEPPLARIRTDRGEFVLDMKDRFFSAADSVHQINLSLANYPDYREVFDMTAKLSGDVRGAAAMTYAVYTGYYYGPAANYVLTDLTDSSANCGTLSHLLFMLLKELDYGEVYFIGLDDIGSELSHLLLQVSGSDGRSYILDPTIGYIYAYDIMDMKRKKVPAPMIFPQKVNLNYLDLRVLLRDNNGINVWMGNSVRETIDKGIISPPLPVKFVSGDCKAWTKVIKDKKVWNLYNAAQGLCGN